jgi:hypothetical protein
MNYLVERMRCARHGVMDIESYKTTITQGCDVEGCKWLLQSQQLNSYNILKLSNLHSGYIWLTYYLCCDGNFSKNSGQMITRHKSYVAIGSYPKDTYAYHAKRISSK